MQRSLRSLALVAASLALAAGASLAQAPAPAPLPPVAPRPTLAQVRRGMVVPSTADTRGRLDSLGYALSAAAMQAVWERSALPPAPESLAASPPPGVAAIICPHDDFSYAGRVYRRVIPLVTAKTVVLFGVFHGYRRFSEHDRVLIDPYRRWTAPDGLVPVSPLRDALLARLPRADWTQDTTAADLEHSLEPIVCWLRHVNPALEIVPILVPASPFPRLEAIASDLADALHAEMSTHGWRLGKDVAIAISADAIHYGPDFRQEAFGAGTTEAYEKAVARDRSLLSGPMSGRLTVDGIRSLYETYVDPAAPDVYRWTWCGRFSVPLGLLVLERLTRASGGAFGHPVAYSTSIGSPELSLADVGMRPTAPSDLWHFVGYPGVAFTTRAR
jgi:AmmeMemoRadiSam system protein B